MSRHTQDNTRTIAAKTLEDLPLSVASNLLSTTNLSRNVRKWRSEGLMAPPNPQTNHGFEIPLNYATTANGEKFLLFDSGINDPKRILIFGTESGKVSELPCL